MAADIVVTAAQVGLVFPEKAEVYTFKTGVTVTAGQVVALATATGLLALADADAGSDLEEALGVALTGGAAGQAISVCKRGTLYGYTISSLAYGAWVWVSATAGAFYDATAGTANQCGKVVPVSDSDLTKVLYVEFSWMAHS
jgi:hypothetical protein